MSIYTIEFTTSIVQAGSKSEAKEMITRYVEKQSKDLATFVNQRAVITEKDIMFGRDDKRLIKY